MSLNMRDLVLAKAGGSHRRLHAFNLAQHVGRHNVERVAGLPTRKDLRIDARVAFLGETGALQNHETAPLRKNHAAAIAGEGTRGSRRLIIEIARQHRKRIPDTKICMKDGAIYSS